ncbi:ribonuclease H-like domain-containing protein [Tanacetum coccineum]|uniref:Ribonuclease H-like domain-containing protein n=1 Tax=Tanacetum coccineum TaxID=301880 RepID=A0ABQ5CDW4_9ASTR
MHSACTIDFEGNWDTHLPLVEFSYSNGYHQSVNYAPFKALYGRRCHLRKAWSQSPKGNQRNWNNQKSQNKACFVCGSFNHVQADCNYHQKERVVSGNNYTRVNYNYSAKKTHPSAYRNMVPRAVLMKTSLRSLNTARPINTAHPKTTVYSARPMSFNTAKGKKLTARPNSAVVNAVRENQGHPQKEDQGYVDNGCSRHMTGNIGKLDFEDVYFVKELQFNLFSVSQMCDKKNSVLFTDTGCFVLSPDFKLADESQVLLKVPRKNNMYSVDMKNIVPKESLTCLVAKATLDESMLWHRRLGHVNFKTINKLVKENLVRGLPTKRFENDQTCVAFLKGKQHKASCKSKIQNSITQPLFMLHMDLFGPTFVSSLMNKKYCLVVTDDYSRFTWVFFLATKDETSGILKSFITKNRVLVVKPHNKTLYELFRGRTPALSFMRPFGCHVTILNTLDYLGKFDRKSDEGFFIGYLMHSKAFRVYNIRTRKVEENLHSRFLDDKPIITGDGPKWLFDIDVLTRSINYVSVVAGTNSNDFVGTEESIGAGHSSKETGSSQDYILMPLWKDGSLFDSSSKNASNDEPRPPSDSGKKDDEGVCKESGIDDQERPKNNNATLDATHADFFGNETEVDMSNITTTYLVPSTPNTRIHKDHSLDHVIGDEEPKRIAKALSDSAWVEAMQEELLQFKLQKVWVLVDLPKGKRAIGTKWVFMNKKDVKGIVIRNKARLVTQGHTQEKGINYDEVFAPVARIKAIMLFLAYVSFMGFMVYQIDVKSAFFYGRIEEEVYVCQPLGFEDPDYPNKVYKVVKALYGLHQAPRACFTYVMTASTSMDTKKPLLKDSDGDDVDVHLYMSMIGSLMYLTSSRLDIMFAVCACARFQVTPKVSHLYVVKRIFSYLKCHPKLGLWYPRDSSFDLVAYYDSDYARASLDRKSTTGGCQFLGCRLISWQYKKQTVVATSSTKAEYVTAASCCGQFCQTATARTLDNGEIELTALIDGTVKTVTEAYVRRHLQLADADGISSLPTTEIFKQLSLMGNMKMDSKGYVGKDIPLFPAMIVQGPVVQGEGSTYPVESHHTPTSAPSTSQPQTFVADEAIHEERGDSVERATTTATRLDTEQGSGNINKTQSTTIPNDPFPQGIGSGGSPRRQDTILGDRPAQTRFERLSKQPSDLPLPRVNTLASNEGSMTQQELMVLCTTLSKKVESLETDLKQTKQIYGAAYTRLIKKGRKIIEIDQDPGISLVQHDAEIQGRYEHDMEFNFDFDATKEVSTAEKDVSTAEPVSTTGAAVTTASVAVSTVSPTRNTGVSTIDDITMAETLLYIKKSAAKDKGKGKMDESENVKTKTKLQQEQERLDFETAVRLQAEFEEEERQRIAMVHEAASSFNVEEWEDIQARVQADEELVAYQSKKEHMRGYTLQQLRGYSFDEIKTLFETTMRSVNTFVPIESEVDRAVPELAVGSSKRAAEEELDQESSKRQKTGESSELAEEPRDKEADELSQEELQQMMIIVPEVGNHTEVHQLFDDMLKAFDKDDLVMLWSLVKEMFNSTEPTDDKEREIWVELKRLFEPDTDDELWKHQNHIHDITWKVDKYLNLSIQTFPPILQALVFRVLLVEEIVWGSVSLLPQLTEPITFFSGLWTSFTECRLTEWLSLSCRLSKRSLDTELAQKEEDALLAFQHECGILYRVDGGDFYENHGDFMSIVMNCGLW